MTTRARFRYAGFILLGGLLATPVRGQTIRGEEIVQYLQPGRWEIEIIPDRSQMTEAQRKKLESLGANQTVRATDCLDANGKSEMLEGIKGSDATQGAQRDAKRNCKTTLTPLGAHEARIVTSCNADGRRAEVVVTCRYTTLEVARRDPDGHEVVFKKARRTGDCK